MEFRSTPLPGLMIIEPERFEDSRGYFMETYRKDKFAPVIGEVDFVQDNESESTGGVLRGMHLQTGKSAQAKLIRVTTGAVYDVAVDLRPDSPTFGQWFGIELSADNGLMMFVPRGFAHGFLVLSAKAKFSYKVDNFYDPSSEVTIAYDDKSLGIEWPKLEVPVILSEKDKSKAVSLEVFKNRGGNP